MQNQVICQNVATEFDAFAERFEQTGELFDLGYHCPPLEPIDSIHYHDALELGLCLQGSAVFWIDGAQYPCTAGTVSVILPGQLHKARSTGSRCSRWVFITVKAAAAPQGLLGGVTAEPAVVRLLQELQLEAEERKEGYERCAEALLQAVLLRCKRGAVAASAPSNETRQYLARLQRVEQYIAAHYREELTVRCLCREVYVHESTLREWFHKALGMSPMQYVRQTRVLVACTLLKDTQLPIGEIAQAVGYQTLSTFNRGFLATCGVCPRAYRAGN